MTACLVDTGHALQIDGLYQGRPVSLLLDQSQKARLTSTELLFPAGDTQLDFLSLLTVKAYQVTQPGGRKEWLHTYSFVLPGRCKTACCVSNGPLRIKLLPSRRRDSVLLQCVWYEVWYPFEKDSFLDAKETACAVVASLTSVQASLKQKERLKTRAIANLHTQRANLKQRRQRLDVLKPLVAKCMHRVVVAMDT